MSSRRTSPAFGTAGVPPTIDLENLEFYQDKWIQRYEKSRRPPPAPQLTSPRSLRACETCRIDAAVQLQKLSLRQQLNAVMGTDIEARLQSVTQGDPVRTRVAMQAALHAFQHAAIGLGTNQEKLVAFHAFEAHETARVARLATAQQARGQVLAVSPPKIRKEVRQTEEASVRTGVRQTSPPRTGPATATGLTGTLSRTRGPTTPSPAVSTAASPLVPYTPRNAEALNSSVFGNRTASDTTCNPSRAYLSASKETPRGARHGEDGSAPRSRPAAAARQPTPTQKSLFPVYREEDSVVSLDSAHMDWALGTATPPRGAKASVGMPRAGNAAASLAAPRHKSEPALPLMTTALTVAAPADVRESSLGANSRCSSSNRAASVSPVTNLEQQQGIFYYCANPRPVFVAGPSS